MPVKYKKHPWQTDRKASLALSVSVYQNEKIEVLKSQVIFVRSKGSKRNTAIQMVNADLWSIEEFVDNQSEQFLKVGNN